MSTASSLRQVRTAAGVLVVTAVLITACTGQGQDQNAAPARAPTSVALPQAGAGPREDVPSGLDDMRDRRLPRPLIDPGQVLSGGPPPDGIPAIDEPRFLRAADVDWIGDREPVLRLTVGGETRGYPVQIMTWHEIVNDTVGEMPVAVTYCPLCNSGLAFERRTAGRLLSFGTSGRLYRDNLVMYDRQTESLWPQLTFTASIGVLTGTRLVPHVLAMVAWQDFRAAHPDAWVLSRDTGHTRDYGRNPYPSYDQPDTDPLFTDPTDRRLPAKERVIGLLAEPAGGQPVAVLRAPVAVVGVREVTVGGVDVVVWHRPGQASALDDEAVSTGRDIGTVGVFQREVDGRRLSFTPVEGGFRDTQTGSTWDVLGRAVSGPMRGTALTAYRHVDTFWFAWVAFQPDTVIVR